MNFSPFLVVFLRLLAPFSLFLNKGFGIVSCVLLDIYDLPILGLLKSPNLFWGIEYHLVDKVLDVWYLFFFFLLSLKWQDKLAKRTSGFLFFWRVIGVGGLLLTQERSSLLFFPNIFENFFLFYIIAKATSPKFEIKTISFLFWILLFVGIPKIFQEYLGHHLELSPAQILDKFTPLNIKEHTIMDWLKKKILSF